MSKCTHSMGAPPASACPLDAEWKGLCPLHGGRHPTVEELMTLLATLTGWGDQSLSVEIGFKRARIWAAQDDSHLDDYSRGFVATTKVVGCAQAVGAQGTSLPAALWALCEEIVRKVGEAHRRRADEATRTQDELAMFVAVRLREPAR